MTWRGAGPSRAWRWPALSVAAALLMPTSNEPRNAFAVPMPRDGPLRPAADGAGCGVAWPAQLDGRGVHALAQCSACHAPDARSVAPSPMLAGWGIERPRPARRAPTVDADGGARVRAGGEVYRHACTHCHPRDRHAASSDALRPQAVSIDGGAVRERSRARALDAPLSDEQTAALAAFLRRHADTPWPDGVCTTRDARL